MSDESTYDRGDTVCVIGAGASGLAAIKNLRERGFSVDCYERETGVGGGWNWRHDRSPITASTHLLASRPCAQYPDFPMPDHWPDFPHHTSFLKYLERYADHFGLREHIWFGSEVTRVEPVTGGHGPAQRWDVTIRGQSGRAARVMRYAAVVVANGPNRAENLPEYDGLSDFMGEITHSSGYKDPERLRGRNVLVVGAGDAGCQIAVEASRTAAVCWHSIRRGFWHLPRYLRGRPYDQVVLRARARGLQRLALRRMFTRMVAMGDGDLTRFGLPAPDHKIFDRVPVVNGQLAEELGRGGITPLPEISRFGERNVTMVDGTVVEPDLVIFATGYVPRFEFLSPETIGVGEDGRPRLRWHFLAPDRPTLAVVGLVKPDGGELACSHWQSVLFAAWLRALDTAPERAAAFWERHRDQDDRRYRAGAPATSRRSWFEVDQMMYSRALERAINDLEATA